MQYTAEAKPPQSLSWTPCRFPHALSPASFAGVTASDEVSITLTFDLSKMASPDRFTVGFQGENLSPRDPHWLWSFVRCGRGHASSRANNKGLRAVGKLVDEQTQKGDRVCARVHVQPAAEKSGTKHVCIEIQLKRLLLWRKLSWTKHVYWDPVETTLLWKKTGPSVCIEIQLKRLYYGGKLDQACVLRSSWNDFVMGVKRYQACVWRSIWNDSL